MSPPDTSRCAEAHGHGRRNKLHAGAAAEANKKAVDLMDNAVALPTSRTATTNDSCQALFVRRGPTSPWGR